MGTKHIPVDGFHGDTGTVFQFHGCLFHGHGCSDKKDAGISWLGTTPDERRCRTESMQSYIKDICGYNLVVMWECYWDNMKQSDPQVLAILETKQPIADNNNKTPTDPGTNMASILQSIQESRLFGMALVDIHTGPTEE